MVDSEDNIRLNRNQLEVNEPVGSNGRVSRACGCDFRPSWHNGRVAVLRLFAQARESAGTNRLELPGSTVGEILDQASGKFGESFNAVLEISNVWLNGEPAERESAVTDGDEVAVLPPVSGG